MLARFALLVTLLAVGATPAAAGAASLTTPIEPKEGGRYPVLTLLTGECNSEAPLPAPQPPPAEQQESRRSSWSVFRVDRQQIALIEPTWGDATQAGPTQWSGPCRASDDPGVVNGTPAFRSMHTGEWEMEGRVRSTPYSNQLCDDGTPCWAPDPSREGSETLVDTTRFSIFQPCAFEVSGVSGRVVKYTTARRTPKNVRRGDVLVRGDILEVLPGGKAALSGDAAPNLGFGPGVYQLPANNDCTELVKGRTPSKLPHDTPPVQIKKGTVEQKAEEAGSIIKAAKDLFNEGIFSKLRYGAPRAAGAGGAIRFRVTRSGRQTKSCALRGRLAVYTTNRRIPASKRRIVLSAGQCAVTRDGRAPKRA